MRSRLSGGQDQGPCAKSVRLLKQAQQTQRGCRRSIDPARRGRSVLRPVQQLIEHPGTG